MKGKLAVLIIFIVIIIALVATWFWLQHIIVEYDIQRALSSSISNKVFELDIL